MRGKEGATMLDARGGTGSSLGPDPSWRPLYRAGAVSAALAAIAYVIALGLFVATPAPPEEGGVAMLEHVDANRSAALVKQTLWVAPNLLMMVLLLALAAAVAHLNKSFAAIAGIVAVASWAVGVAWPTTGEGSLAMVVLSDRYAEATTDAARAPFVAGAELLLAVNDRPAVTLGVLQTFGILLIALLMPKGAFSIHLARLGVATDAIGIVVEALRPVLGWAYAVYGLVLFAWLVCVAVALRRMGAEPRPAMARKPVGRNRHQATA
jgi:hypothetical protein